MGRSTQRSAASDYCQPARDSTMSPLAKTGIVVEAIAEGNGCRPPSRRRSAPAPHRTVHRSSGRGSWDRATARWCATGPGPRRAPAGHVHRCGSRTLLARRRDERRERRVWLATWGFLRDIVVLSLRKKRSRRASKDPNARFFGEMDCFAGAPQ